MVRTAALSLKTWRLWYLLSLSVIASLTASCRGVEVQRQLQPHWASLSPRWVNRCCLIVAECWCLRSSMLNHSWSMQPAIHSYSNSCVSHIVLHVLHFVFRFLSESYCTLLIVSQCYFLMLEQSKASKYFHMMCSKFSGYVCLTYTVSEASQTIQRTRWKRGDVPPAWWLGTMSRQRRWLR